VLEILADLVVVFIEESMEFIGERKLLLDRRYKV
jgi:hypothetical protein